MTDQSDALITRIHQAALPAPLLIQLFEKLKTPVSSGALIKACALSEQQAEASPMERFNAIAKQIKLRGAQPAALWWRRFDRRKLPALLFFQDRWLLAEMDEEGEPLLRDEQGECIAFEPDQLDTALVLWVRVAEPTEKRSVFSSENIAARMVWRELFRKTGWLRDVLIATVIINLLAVSTSLFAMQVYDRVVPTMAYATLWTLVAGMGMVVSLDWLLKTFRARTLDSIAAKVDQSVSEQVFDHVMRLRLDLQPKSTGTLAAQVTGLDSVRQFFSSSVVFALIDMPFALMFIVFIAAIGSDIAWVYFALLPVALLLGWLTQMRLRRLLRKQMMRANERQGMLVDTIRGAETIRANNATWRFAEQWQAITASVSRYSLRQKAISSFASVTTGSLASIAYVLAVVVGVTLIEAGELTMGALIACSILGGRVIAPVAQSVQQLSQWQNVSQALQMTNQVLQIAPERPYGHTLLMPERTPDQMQLDRVRFSYPTSPVKQLDVEKLTFNAGDRVLLLGPVGGGKSTLLKALAGLYRPTEGQVRLGDADLWEIDPEVVNNHVGYLPQTVQLFKGTLFSNLALSGTVNEDRMLNVCRELGIDQIAANDPRSMNLEISEGGEGLSGGQRQLVALARIIMAQPRIWLLDEPTASLDSDSESQALETLARYVRSDDILIVATHRPVIAASIANRVIVMQQGKVTQDGTPQQVLSRRVARPAASSTNLQGGPAHVI